MKTRNIKKICAGVLLVGLLTLPIMSIATIKASTDDIYTFTSAVKEHPNDNYAIGFIFHIIDGRDSEPRPAWSYVISMTMKTSLNDQNPQHFGLHDEGIGNRDVPVIPNGPFYTLSVKVDFFVGGDLVQTYTDVYNGKLFGGVRNRPPLDMNIIQVDGDISGITLV